MSRVEAIKEDQADAEVQEIYNKIQNNGARIINLYRVLAQSPRVLRDFLRLGSTLLSKSGLSPKLREMAILRVAKITGSEYEWRQHYPIALEVGVTAEQAEAVSDWRNSDSFDEEEKAVLQYTDEVAQNVAAKDETYRTLRKYLDDQHIVELTVSIGYWGMVARVLVALEVDIDQQTIGSAKELFGR
jgi:alkylhydroperoxidase family enzyme